MRVEKKMNLFKSIYKTLGNYIKRFSGVLIASAVTAVLFVLYSLFSDSFISESEVSTTSKILLSFLKCGELGIVFSVFAGICSEYFLRDDCDRAKVAKISFIAQICGMAFAFFPLYFFCRLDSSRSTLIYGCLTGALVILCGYFLTVYQSEENIVQNTWEAILLAFGSVLSVCGGAGLILAAINYLFVEVDDSILMAVMGFFGILIFANVFVAYATSKEENQALSKLYKIVVKYVLFTIYAALILILYLYFIKCLVVQQWPVHTYVFVSSAVLAFLFFYFTLLKYREEKIIGFFYKFGYLFLIPLIVIQIISYAIRVNAYGFTGWRVASLVYIVFSVIVVILAGIKSGKYMKLSLPVFSALLIVVSCTPFNPVTFPIKNQMARVGKIIGKHGYVLEKGLSIPDGNEIFTISEKAEIVDKFFYLGTLSDTPEWLQSNYKNRNERFKEIFGFEYRTDYDSQVHSYYIDSHFAKLDLDISPYKEIIEIEKVNTAVDENSVKIVDVKNTEYDVSEFVKQCIDIGIKNGNLDELKGPAILHYDNNSDIVITKISLSISTREDTVERQRVIIAGYILKK